MKKLDFSKREGLNVIIEGPSGVGKGSIVKQLLADDPLLHFSVSVTTRAPREGEIEGKHYYFISNEKYDEYLKQNAFYEYNNNSYGKRYGTLREKVDPFLAAGKDVLYDMDWVGARQMRQNAKNVITIYILPPSIAELRKRLEGRGTDDKATIDSRMAVVAEKISHWKEFDYLVINDQIEDAVTQIQSIIRVERTKRERATALSDFAAELEEEANSTN